VALVGADALPDFEILVAFGPGGCYNPQAFQGLLESIP
jgi:hypothetical protein